MPERWEREVRKLRGMEPREHVIRDRAARGPSQDRRPPRRNALVAGVVAGAVAIAGVAFLGQLDEGGPDIGGVADDLPTLLVTFESGRMIVDQPDEQVQRVNTTIVYGDAREENFTSTISETAHVDWVGVGDLTRFVPGPTAGSQVRFDADGADSRILIGRPADWPEFRRFTEIDRLPEEPGDYVLVFEATYAEGIARTARSVRIVAPRTMQLAITTRGWDATADAYVDGARTDGLLSASWRELSGTAEPTIPAFGPEAVVQLVAESPIILATEMSHARGGFFGEDDSVALDAALPLAFSDVESAPSTEGQYLLALEVGWNPGDGSLGASPAALFLFPIEIVPASEQEPSPPPVESPTPEPGGTDVVTIDIRRSSEETGGPQAFARFGTQEQWMCPDGFSLVNPDGTTDEIMFDCGQDAVFQAPVGTPIEVTGDFETVNVTTRMEGDRVPGSSEVVPALEAGSILTLTYEVTWDDGSEASFWLQLTVSVRSPTAESSVLRMRCGPVGAEVLTPVVAAQPDGVHLRIEDARPLDAVEFANAAEPNGSFGGPVRDGTGVWPIEPGMFYVECLDSLAETYQGLETARFEVVDPNGYWVPGIPECREEDRLMKVNTYESGGADYIDDETTIRALLHSIEPMDSVRLPFYPEGGGAKDLRYVVVRDDHVVAALHVGLSDDQDPYGPGLTEVRGQACASSGIAQGSIA